MSRLKFISKFNLLLALFIILWGAWVRLSGSGAGCGEHWPLCNGDVLPVLASQKTMIEFIHRLTSGIFGLTVLLGLFLSAKAKDTLLTRSFSWTLFFTITEALIGAFLVVKGLVVKDDSALRALTIALHLVNTFILLYFLVQNIFIASKAKISNFRLNRAVLSIFTLFGLAGATGAIAALGNTLFPENSLVEGVLKDFDSTSHFLIQLRIFHPGFALGLVAMIWVWCAKTHSFEFKVLRGTCVISVVWGIINWLLLAPTWGALVHLFLADLLFVNFCWCYFLTRRV